MSLDTDFPEESKASIEQVALMPTEKTVLIVLAYAWALLACVTMTYYGSFVFTTPINPLGSEARLGVWLGFTYGAPAWLILVVAAWRIRRRDRKILTTLLALPALYSLAYMVCLYAVIWRAGVT